MTATITSTANTGGRQTTTTWWRTKPALVGGAALVLLLAFGLFNLVFGGEDASQDGPIYTVASGPLTINVTESGTIQAREQVVLKCEVEGQTTIIWIVEEGKHVKEGDLLVELDSSERQDELLEQQIRVKNAEASYIRAREALEITRSQGESDISKAELAYEFAKEDLTKYVEGEYPKELDEMNARIKLAQADLEDAEKTFTWSVTLHEEKYISEADRDRDELRRDRAKLDLDNAEADLKLLQAFTYKRRVRELESDVEQTEMALERVKRQANANLVQDEADLTARELELKRQKERLAKDEDMLIKTKIYAPTDGMVIYATTGQDRRRGNDEPLEAGRAVREREELIHLPTANSMLVNIKIHESSLKKVQVDQPVRVTINALPGREFFGKVTRIAPLPDAQSFWRGNPDLKVYNTEIFLDGELTGVRTGMTCKAEVIVQHLDDALSVPVQSVIRVDGKPTVYVKNHGKPEPVNVELGLDNKDYIHIVSGLAAGDRVLINPPLEETGNAKIKPDETDEPDADDASQDTADASDEAKPAAPQPPAQDGRARLGQDAGQAKGQAPAPGQGRPSPEQMKNMTPEQREKMRQQRQQRGPRPQQNGGEQK